MATDNVELYLYKPICIDLQKLLQIHDKLCAILTADSS